MSERVKRTTLVVVDDHPVYRQGLVELFRARPEFEVVGEADDGPAAIVKLRELKPDVAVVDVNMPGRNGIQVIEAIRRDELPTHVVIVSAETDSGTVFAAIEAGARAYVPKEASGGPICDAVAAVARGETVFPPEIHEGLATQIRMRADRHDRPILSSRELDVLRLAAEGFSTREMALHLHLGEGTIKTHLQHIYDKLEVSDRAAAVAAGMRRGLLE